MNESDENMTAYVRYRLEKAQEVYQAACVYMMLLNGIQ